MEGENPALPAAEPPETAEPTTPAPCTFAEACPTLDEFTPPPEDPPLGPVPTKVVGADAPAAVPPDPPPPVADAMAEPLTSHGDPPALPGWQ